jgi:hypothetical protein
MKVYQIEIEASYGNLRLDTIFLSAERAEQHVQGCKKPLVLKDGTQLPPMEFESHKIIELEVVE